MKKQIPELEQIKINSILKKIELNDFDECNIELLLIKLREYSQRNSIFEEIAHFIAHHERDSGLIHSKLYQFYCRIRFFQEYQNTKNQKVLDFYSPIEKYVYDFFLNGTDTTHSKEFKKTYGFSREQALSKIKTSFDKQKDEMYICSNPTDKMLINTIKLLSLRIRVQAFTTLEKIIKSIIQTLRENNFIFDEKKILQSKRLQLNILILLHKRKFYTNDGFLGHTFLTTTTDNFGKLQNISLLGKIKLENIEIMFPLIKTTFTKEIIDNNLIIKKNLDDGVIWESFDNEANITLSNEKLKIIKLNEEM